jgi:hypothetical protein
MRRTDQPERPELLRDQELRVLRLEPRAESVAHLTRELAVAPARDHALERQVEERRELHDLAVRLASCQKGAIR